MKFSTLALTSLVPSAAWAWAGIGESASTGSSLFRRAETIQQTTDRYLFSITLPQFHVYRNARNPANLDWSSDGCSYSPDNPLGFPFTPACDRHDFGYRNYKAQSRFTDANRLNIDANFKDDLYYQCDVNGHGSVCRGLANVYYSAVRAFGRTKGELQEEYELLLAHYNELVAEAIDKGEDPLYY
ncbi:prokaryotic phospholipase A2-domain-containing protein [Sordaria brevicollis]|uniref:Prokaryotic phospholipase A2-domain-containing protein n=1 Tax=Sordaria brevicollis TaxID=83679 RepID=A0AAE0UH13_SORBR|nr:prokaryotic phospholipase A2-domain-containing protein [Sordaria brevicollis]